jgi:hypothetical protein
VQVVQVQLVLRVQPVDQVLLQVQAEQVVRAVRADLHTQAASSVITQTQV